MDTSTIDAGAVATGQGMEVGAPETKRRRKPKVAFADLPPQEQLRQIGADMRNAEKASGTLFRDAIGVVMNNANAFEDSTYCEFATLAYLGADEDGWEGSPQTIKNTKSLFNKARQFSKLFGRPGCETFLTTLPKLKGRLQDNTRKLLTGAIEVLSDTPKKLTAEWMVDAANGRVPVQKAANSNRQKEADKAEADAIAHAEPAPRPEGVLHAYRQPLGAWWAQAVKATDEIFLRLDGAGVMDDTADELKRQWNSVFVALEDYIKKAAAAEARKATEAAKASTQNSTGAELEEEAAQELAEAA